MKNRVVINIVLLFGLLLNSCVHKSDEKSINSSESKEHSKWVVVIQPLGEVNPDYLTFVKRSLQGEFSSVRILPKINLPKKAFVPIRRRYDANKLLWFLEDLYITRKYSNEIFLVGVTESDICQNRTNPKEWKDKKGFGSPDYGIIGLGYQPKTKKVVRSKMVNINSTKRLYSNKKEQLVKLIKHELGHNFGLPHCPNKSCIMRDAEGVNHFDEMTGFCENCKKQFAK